MGRDLEGSGYLVGSFKVCNETVTDLVWVVWGWCWQLALAFTFYLKPDLLLSFILTPALVPTPVFATLGY